MPEAIIHNVYVQTVLPSMVLTYTLLSQNCAPMSEYISVIKCYYSAHTSEIADILKRVAHKMSLKW